METAPLKSFATWARAALIREVTARIAVVLAPASPERVEQPNAVAALEKAVKAAGGGEAGRVALADKVAYTWFNRIIALRFMDANGYTGIGVVSPERGRDGGQPEVLAEAKRGNIDSAVVTNTRTVVAVTSLLNGTRRSDDPQGEAYSLLLAEYCRQWNRAMPFMFEREGDFTELLIPANLLADDSVLARAVTVLTEDVCQDVEVIGWLYQFYISERKDEVFAGFKKNQKAGAAEIPAATQLFTPHWIVRYLVENSLGRLWLLNRPASRLAEQMDYYIAPVDEESDFLRVTSPEALKIIDPACGSGHMLTYAFDLLYLIYEEEGYAPSDIPGLILANNLFGTEIDPRAGGLAAFALTMKARAKQRTFFNKQVKPNICVIEPISFGPEELDFLVTRDGDRERESAFWNQFSEADTFGSLIRSDTDLTTRLAHHLETLDDGGDMYKADAVEWAGRVVRQGEFLAPRYSVVVANPPYMGAKSMGSRLAEFAKSNYPKSKSDLFAMFVERSIGLASERGFIAMITMQTWLFLSTYEALRGVVLSATSPVSLAHLGARAFDTITGEVVNTASFVLAKDSSRTARARFLRLGAFNSEATKSAAMLTQVAGDADGMSTFERTADFFRKLPGRPFAFWLDDALSAAFASDKSLGGVLRPKIGMRTGNNERFLRRWYEVSYKEIAQGHPNRESARATGLKWFPYNKGGGLRRWYGNQDFVLDWFDDGRDIKAETLLNYPQLSPDNLGWKISNEDWYFKEGITWSDITTTGFAARYSPQGFIFDVKGSSGFANGVQPEVLLALLNSSITHEYMAALNPSTTLQVGDIAKIPFIPPRVADVDRIVENTRALVEIARMDWDAAETSWGFVGLPMMGAESPRRLRDWSAAIQELWSNEAAQARELEASNEALLCASYSYEPTHQTAGFEGFVLDNVGRGSAELMVDLVSYAVGCMFGRYSLDEPGLILSNHGATMRYYLAKVPSQTFTPDADNVIPIVDGDWFEDDIVARFRHFLRVAFGEQHFEENLRFVTESLGVKDVRDYFVKSFYKDHVQRYKKRPIYWLFSSPKGSFNALIYMHRYTPSTVSTVLNEYLREFKAKLEASRQHHERLAIGTGTPREMAAALKEVDRLRKVLLELDEYEHDVLYPLATQQVQIDLDDGVKANYPKFGAALKKIPGLEVRDE
jgi:Eco57I restriction-modification methylase